MHTQNQLHRGSIGEKSRSPVLRVLAEPTVGAKQMIRRQSFVAAYIAAQAATVTADLFVGVSEDSLERLGNSVALWVGWAALGIVGGVFGVFVSLAAVGGV